MSVSVVEGSVLNVTTLPLRRERLVLHPVRRVVPAEQARSAPPAPEREPGPRTRSLSGWAGGVAGFLTFAGWMVGADRAFGYDAAVTMRRFVAVPLGQVLGDQLAWNNHPLFSLLEHAVWRATGSAGEITMRVAPAALAAAAVGLLAWRLGRRFGTVAGLAGAAVVAVNPLLADARDVRGYSLALLAVVVMGVAVLDVSRPWLLAVGLAVGLGTHLYTVVPAVALVVYLLAARRFDGRWPRAAVLGSIVGLSFYAAMLEELGRGGRLFRPLFLRDVAWATLGGEAVAVAAAGLLVAVAARAASWTRPQLALAASLAAGVIGPWLLAPYDLYVRFAFWIVPALGLGVAAAVAARPFWGVAASAVLVAATLVPQLDGWTEDAIPNRELAAHAEDACLLGWGTQMAARWYLPDAEIGAGCERGALLFPGTDAETDAIAERRWPVVCWSVARAEVRAEQPAAC